MLGPWNMLARGREGVKGAGWEERREKRKEERKKGRTVRHLFLIEYAVLL